MINKKFWLSFSLITGTLATVTVIGAGYAINSMKNSYWHYGKAPISASVTDLIQAYFAAAVNGSKLLYLASFSHSKPITEALNIFQNKPMYEYFSKTGYILIDDKFGFPQFNNGFNGLANTSQPIWSTNVASVQFRSDLGSFITGIAAAQLLNEHQDYFIDPNKKDDKLTWATYGGAPYSSVTSFMGGFQRGVNWFNENIAKPSNGKWKELYQYIPELDENNFAGGFAPNTNPALIDHFLQDNRIDLIFPIAGPQIKEITKIIKEHRYKTVIIGVDSPSEKDSNINIDLPIKSDNPIGGNNRVIQFSSVKNIDVLTYKITRLINNDQGIDMNTPDWNNVGGIGYSSLGDVDNSGVGVSEAGQSYFIRAMQEFAKITNTELDVSNSDIAYTNATRLLSQQPEFKQLNDVENKYYIKKDWKYDDISNSGAYMLPIYSSNENIAKWYDYTYKDNELAISNKDKNLIDISSWIETNKKMIDFRKDTKIKLQNQFNKNDWEKNKGVIKIIFESQSSVLFDKSFLESCYLGLRDYWKTKGVSIPEPPTVEFDK